MKVWYIIQKCIYEEILQASKICMCTLYQNMTYARKGPSVSDSGLCFGWDAPPEGGWLHGKLLSSMTLGFAGGQRIIFDTHAIKTSKRSIGVCLSISLWVHLLTLFGARATNLNISSPKDQTMLLSKTSALVWTTDSVEQGLCTNGDYHPLNMLPFMCLFRTYINP